MLKKLVKGDTEVRLKMKLEKRHYSYCVIEMLEQEEPIRHLTSGLPVTV
jgi:hypothetical protein